MLDILFKIRHEKFEHCNTSNLDTAILFVAITAHCSPNKSSYKLVQKGWSENWKRNYYKNQEKQMVNSFENKALQ